MESTRRAIDPEELLAQMGWVAGLARSLVRDPSVAQDVAQDAMVLAMERPPHTATSGPGLRAWLASVTRTLARQSARSTRRRTAREQRVARNERETSTYDVVERGELQQNLARTVMQLDEPYRSTILYRYLDGLSAPEIAKRQGVSAAAVRKRLSRGLARMRARLDHEHGHDRRSWVLAMVPLVFPGDATSAATTVTVGARLPVDAVRAPAARVRFPTRMATTGLGVTMLVASAVLLLFNGTDTPGAVETAPTVPVSAPDASLLPAHERALSAGGRDRSAPRPVPTGNAAPALPMFRWPSLPRPVRGRVFDVAGAPMAGVRLRFEPDAIGTPGTSPARGTATLTAMSETDGAFELDDVDSSGRILVASSGLVTVLGARVGRGWNRTGSLMVTVAPRRPLDGHVRDALGTPVGNATVAVHLPIGFASRFGEAMDGVARYSCETHTDETGHFELHDAPSLDGLRLVAHCNGFESHDQPAPDGALSGLAITLQRPRHVLSGQVVDERGTALPSVTVSCGLTHDETDGAGAFTLWLDDRQLDEARSDGTTLAVAVTVVGRQPRQHDIPLPDVQPDGVRWNGLQLEAGPAALSISGRVVDGSGLPVEAVAVWIADPTVLARHERRAYADEQGTTTGARSGYEAPPLVLAENVAIGEPDVLWKTVRTDADGDFKLDGLADRDYVVAALEGWTLSQVSSAPVAAGSHDVRLVLDLARVHTRVSGRVVAPDGTPLADVQVAATTAAFSVAGTRSLSTGAVSRTRADGTFTLDKVAWDGTWLLLSGPHVLPLVYGEREGQPLQDTAAIIVERRVDLAIRLDDPTEADRFAVLDAAGKTLPLHVLRFDLRRELGAAPLVEGRSEVVAVSERAATLVLYHGEIERRRLDLDPRPDSLNVVP